MIFVYCGFVLVSLRLGFLLEHDGGSGKENDRQIICCCEVAGTISI